MQTGKLEYKKVTKLVAPHPDKLIELHIAGETVPLRPTPSHPFYVKRSGETQADWIKASDIKIGDAVLSKKGSWSRVTAISPIEKPESVYNFEVEGNHDYFVGAAGLLVHNGGPCAFGTEIHQNFEEVLTQQTGTIPEDWIMRTDPGIKGIDAEYVGPAERYPGFDYAELKPANSNIPRFTNQLDNWGLPKGQASLWWYSKGGVIGNTGTTW
jgi:hypothetical protein